MGCRPSSRFAVGNRGARLAVAAIALALGSIAAAEPPTPPDCAAAIDAIVEREAVGPVAAPCADAEFVRRAHLDLAGAIPTADRVRAFLADPGADKRSRIVDELLDGPAFSRHLALVLDAWLLERKGAGGEAAAWREWLATALATDRPLDQICADVIAADGAEPLPHAAATFLLVREVDPLRLTRSIGRVFLGRDLECCQCHDHPDNADLRQDDYHALRAFVDRSSLFKPAADKPALVGEKADGEVDYTSVFTKESVKGVRPRVPAGPALVDEPLPEAADAYLTAPAKDVRGVARHGRRAALARLLVESEEFSRVLANRLWAHLFGRGLVHPLDGHDPDNPPVHPDVLALLAERLRADGFHVRALVRGIALSRTYQRSVVPPPLDPAGLDALVERLAAERTAAEAALLPLATAQAAAAARRQALLDADAAAVAAAAPLREPRDKARAAADAAATALKGAADDLAAKTAQASALAAAASQAGAAAKLLADDKVLAGAAAIIEARSVEFTPVVEGAKGVLAARTTEEEAARGGLAAARAAFDEVLAKRFPVAERAAADRAALAAAAAWRDARAALARIDLRLALAADILRHGELAATDPAGAAALAASIDERRTALGQVARVRALSPEQLALSLATATGADEAARAAATAALDKEPPAVLRSAAPEIAPRLRAVLVELGAVSQQAGLVNTVAGLYGDPLAGEFQASVNQALWLGNAPDVANRLAPSGGSLVGRLVALADDTAVADEATLAILSRPAEPAERDDLVRFLADRGGDRPAAIAELVWALLASAEFRFNH
ncbi:MAG: DUF1549 domain-containing protein [Planctomycetota bacterium]